MVKYGYETLLKDIAFHKLLAYQDMVMDTLASKSEQ